MKTKSPIHLLLRFSDSLLKEGDTIEEHNQVIQRQGVVWFGKMGSTVSQSHIDILNEQVGENIPTYVYLVKGNRRKSTVYRARLAFASKTLPKGESQRVPAYYSSLDISKYVNFWVKLTEIIPIDFGELKRLRVGSSVLPIQETLTKSSSGHFFLKEEKYPF